jgi:sulfatase maturation enzyme AslB (radical SAM superfamily)
VKVQSLSICVPGGCPNNCKFCVSKIHRTTQANNWNTKDGFSQQDAIEFEDRMAFARDNGCNSMVFTGDGEPMENQKFIQTVMDMNKTLEHPFRWIEIQTSGVNLTDEKLEWLKHSGVKTIALSTADIFDNVNNAKIMGIKAKNRFEIESVCSRIKAFGFNLRICINLSDTYTRHVLYTIARCANLGANQTIFRVLYTPLAADQTSEAHKVTTWIRKHRLDSDDFNAEMEYAIKNHGRKLEVLPFGSVRYAINGVSTIVDNDCMSESVKEEIRYLILRPDCKLYTKWDEIASLLF